MRVGELGEGVRGVSIRRNGDRLGGLIVTERSQGVDEPVR